ncbi:MAG TPA: hypothetical protein DCP90_02770 [Clostridiales bacterium]|nr:MAG: hypothetical protein A2Y22_00015 [Clostridiales bacterium GWD2_32_59]HAN09516.1 hypothetical protein [Clostridiales bacterium]
MIIYFAHSRDEKLDYYELYNIIKQNSVYKRHEIILPHDNKDSISKNSKEIIQKCDLFIAEVSFNSVGLGVEIGRAEMCEIPMLLLHKEGKLSSRSLKFVTDNIISYKSLEDFSNIIQTNIENIERMV